MNRERIGFIGLGDIGAPIAMRILDAGFPLRVYNRTATRMEPFVARGAQTAASATELARECDIVFLCVSNAEAVEAVVFGGDGVAQGGRPGMLLVDVSTVHPVKTQEMAQRLARDHAMGWVDAPVSGGTVGARAGTLAVMAGGSAAEVERVRPVLMSFAGRVTHMGGVGCGMAMKAFNQMLSFGTGAVIAETMNMAARFGIDPALIPEAVAGGFADSNVLRHYAPQMVSGDLKGNTLTGMKDLDIAMDLGRLTGSPLPVTSLVSSFFRIRIAQGDVACGLATPMRMYAQGPLLPLKKETGK